jgi:hypothetical protein
MQKIVTVFEFIFESSFVAIRAASEYGYEEIVKILIKDSRVNPGALNNYGLSYITNIF